MSKGAPQGAKLLFGWKRPNRFDTGVGALLPPEYHKFLAEYKTPKAAVHYIPKQGKYERNEKTGEVKPIQNVPLPLIYPPESHEGIWGGEGIVKGFQKRHPTKRRVPHFWFPTLRKSVVHSVILNKFMAMVVTSRTLELIHKHNGFDNYILETKASDLQSMLAIKIKCNMLKAIHDGCPDLADDPEKQQEILNKYKQFGDKYTPAELEWYGLTYPEAITKKRSQLKAEQQSTIKPKKYEFREKLIAELKEMGIDQVEQFVKTEDGKIMEKPKGRSWISKFNPFGKK